MTASGAGHDVRLYALAPPFVVSARGRSTIRNHPGRCRHCAATFSANCRPSSACSVKPVPGTSRRRGHRVVLLAPAFALAVGTCRTSTSAEVGSPPAVASPARRRRTRPIDRSTTHGLGTRSCSPADDLGRRRRLDTLVGDADERAKNVGSGLLRSLVAIDVHPHAGIRSPPGVRGHVGNVTSS